MSEFSKKIYGYSVHNDMTPGSSTRNFEYNVLRSEVFETPIKKLQPNKELSTKVSSFSKCFIKRFDSKIPQRNHEEDLETQMSRMAQQKLRKLNDEEIVSIMSKATRNLDYESGAAAVGKSNSSMKRLEGGKSNKDISKDFDSLMKTTASNLKEVDSLISNLREKKQIKYATSSTTQFFMPSPQRAEILETPQTYSLVVKDIQEPRLHNRSLTLADLLDKFSGNNSLPIPKSDNSDAISIPLADSENDYEDLYKRFCYEPEKSVPSETEHLLDYAELEAPRGRMNLKFINNTVEVQDPYRDYVEGIGDAEFNDPKMESIESYQQGGKQITKAPKTRVPIASPMAWNPKTNPTKMSARPKSARISDSPRPVVVYSARPPISRFMASTKKTLNNASHEILPSRPKPLSRFFSGRQKGTKTIEELKTEKVRIFTKMTRIHEKIIELLDKIRMALLEVYIPNSTHEKNKRQKNAMEFSVRFARNFLYPLKGMIDDLSLANPSTLNSATSNHASGRVMSIFGLLQHSLLTYHKQLRFFLSDIEPEKLNHLLDMIQTTTKICLQKGLFDPKDTIIHCLQDRCQKFTEFLNELKDKRSAKKSREQVDNTNQKSKSAITGKSGKNYDLKMFMNDLNMYEPKLLPKSNYRKPARKLKDKKVATKPSEELTAMRMETVSTHIMHTNTDFGHSQQSSSEGGREEKETTDTKDNVESRKLKMAKMFHKALDKATKKQVCQVLEPLIQSFNSSIDNSTSKNTDNSETAEALIKAFTSKILNDSQNSNGSEVPHKVKHKRCKVVTTGKSKNGNSKRYRVNHHYGTSRASKARKPTKLLRQQKSNKANADDIITTYASAEDGSTEAEAPTQRNADGTLTNTTNNDDNENYEFYNDNLSLTIGSSNHSANADYDDDHDHDDDSNTNDDDDNEVESDDDRNRNCAGKERNSRLDAGYCIDAGSSHASSTITRNVSDFLRKMNMNSQMSKSNVFFNVPQRDNSPCEIPEDGDEERALFWSTIHQVEVPEEMKLNIKKSSSSSSSSREFQKPQEAVKNTKNTHKPCEKPVEKTMKPTSNVKIVRKTRLYGNKKIRDPLATPPPAPVVTPSNSARSQKRNEQMEVMRRELQKAYQVPQQPTPNGQAMTSGAQTSKIMKSTEVPLTKKFEMNSGDDENILNKNHNTVKTSNQSTSRSSDNTRDKNLGRLDTVSKKFIACGKKIDMEYQNQKFGNQGNRNQMEENTPKSPYDAVKRISECLQDLPKVHEDKLLQQFMEKEREMYRVFNEEHFKDCLPDMNEMALRMASMQAEATEAKKMASIKLLPPPPPASVCSDNEYQSSDHVEDLLHERNRFMEICRRNRFYSNPSYEQPWNVFARIANEITQEIVVSVEDDFSSGLGRFVKDFLEVETQL